MIDPNTLPTLWRRLVETTTTGELPPHDGPVLAYNSVGGIMQRPKIEGTEDTIAAYRPLLDVATLAYGPLVERATTTTRAWTEKPPNDDTEIRVLWSDGEVSVDRGEKCQSPWYGTRGQTHEIGWTTVGEWAAFLTRPTAVVPEVVRRCVRYVINSSRYIGAAKSEMSAWLAALPPITPEVANGPG
jgi:hypothetical protein